MDSRMLAKWNKWLAFEHRTTNMAEAWHNAMKYCTQNCLYDSYFYRSTIRCQHPPYSTLLEKLKNEETATNNFLANRLYVRIQRNDCSFQKYYLEPAANSSSSQERSGSSRCSQGCNENFRKEDRQTSPDAQGSLRVSGGGKFFCFI